MLLDAFSGDTAHLNPVRVELHSPHSQVELVREAQELVVRAQRGAARLHTHGARFGLWQSSPDRGQCWLSLADGAHRSKCWSKLAW